MKKRLLKNWRLFLLTNSLTFWDQMTAKVLSLRFYRQRVGR